MPIRWAETRAPAAWLSLSNLNNNIKSSRKRYVIVTNCRISVDMVEDQYRFPSPAYPPTVLPKTHLRTHYKNMLLAYALDKLLM